MAQELVRLTNQNDEMEEKVKEIPKLKVQLKVQGCTAQGINVMHFPCCQMSKLELNHISS